jgi:hypothetical protein
MSGRWDRRTPFPRVLAYAVAAVLIFVVAAGIGAVAALMVSGNPSSPAGEKAGPDESSPKDERGKPAQTEQAGAGPSQQQDSDAKQGKATPRDRQTAYVDKVGEIQVRSVDAFVDSHEMLLHYDSLTSGDVKKMKADQAALGKAADQAGALVAPEKYKEHKDVFLSAIDGLHQAARSAYALAADPVSANQADFDSYDHLVNEAAADLQRSDEILGKDYKTIEGVRGVSTSQ